MRKDIKYNLQACLEEIEPNIVFDTDEMYTLKTKILGLDQTDRTIILLYLELQSMEKVGKVLNVSPSTIYQYIKKIREKVI